MPNYCTLFLFLCYFPSKTRDAKESYVHDTVGEEISIMASLCLSAPWLLVAEEVTASTAVHSPQPPQLTAGGLK